MEPSDTRGMTLAIDIGGTFTDAVLEVGGQRHAAKVLTTSPDPDRGFLESAHQVLKRASLAASDVGLIIHGTTLATNAIIERKGARLALICTEGMRDSLEMAYEHRFEQSDLFMERPAPLVPRHLRLPVRERLAADGSVLIPLDEASVERLVPPLEDAGVESVAIGLIHSYANPAHERRVGQILGRHLRYRRQGHEVAVSLPIRAFAQADAELFLQSFDREYRLLYGRTIPTLSFEAMSWSLSLAESRALPERARDVPPSKRPAASRTRAIFDSDLGAFADVPVYARSELSPGAFLSGPVLILEDETSSLVNKNHDVLVNGIVINGAGDVDGRAGTWDGDPQR